jgi:hypothetical protein
MSDFLPAALSFFHIKELEISRNQLDRIHNQNNVHIPALLNKIIDF